MMLHAIDLLLDLVDRLCVMHKPYAPSLSTIDSDQSATSVNTASQDVYKGQWER